MIFNPELNQLITVCTESVIKVWEAETGKHVYSINNAHGTNAEVTAVTLDKSGYRLATGALDGEGILFRARFNPHQFGRVVAHLVEHSLTDLLAIASVGSNLAAATLCP